MTRPDSRPYVILNSAMSLDGKIATAKGDSQLSSREDLKRVHRLRGSVDGVMIGSGTLIADNPKLTVKIARGRNPQRIIVDSKARTPLNSNVVRTATKTPTIIAVTSGAPRAKVRALEGEGVRILSCGKGPRVSLPLLLRQLRTMGIRKILLEGGGTLNWSMLSEGLVDEVSVAISPRILGGSKAVTLAEGSGTAATKDAVKIHLFNIKRYGSDTVLSYTVRR